MARIDHTGHDHPMTPAGRAACRKASGGLTLGRPYVEAVPADDQEAVQRQLTDSLRVYGYTIGDQELTPRKSRRVIQERAAGARATQRGRERAAAKVARRPVHTGGCVQAEMHRSPGKCACGFRSPGWKD